ncbi:UxaA family hydrolase [Cellvibrio japonicus]|nr:UxaA family hydrolase [Cellvibrio japonicus]QEI17669.1 UxaA family hydrolase [Cellvibrio japonicus]QEI21243.1 UxaA family hydrolase [Cellvibrio japonicus]
MNKPVHAAVASLILLHPTDNVLICVSPIHAGDAIVIDGTTLVAPMAISVGHKVARLSMSPGDKVLRYGAPIGSITEPVNQGEHVHMHNMKSDYIPSHTRSRQSQYRSES